MQETSAGAKSMMDKPPKTFFKILVVDDEQTIRRLLAGILEHSGYTDIDQVDSGEEAIKAFSQRDYHLILLDKNLPGIDGLKVLSKAKQTRPGVEVIIVTGYASLDSAIQAIDLGAFGYITKPFHDIQAVVTRVEAALDRAAIRYQGEVLLGRVNRVLELLKQADSEMDRQGLVRAVRDAMTRLTRIAADLKRMG